ncbi:MAG: glycosyltransferase [Pseudomonadota bacterium]
MDRPDILFVITSAALGGAQTHLLELVKGLRSRFHLHVAYGQPGPLTSRLNALGVTTTQMPSLARTLQPLQDMQALRAFGMLLGQLAPRLIHAHSAKAGLIARWCGPRFEIPVLYTAHGWGFADGAPTAHKWLSLALERTMAPRTTGLITLTQADAQSAQRMLGYRADKIHLIANGRSDRPLLTAPRSARLSLLMLGRLCAQKNQAQALRLFARLPKGRATLTLVGDGPDRRKLEIQAGRLNLGPDEVIFTGDLDDPQTHLSAADIVLHSAHYEGMPYAIIEAFRAGKPILANSIPAHEELISHNENGLLFQSEIHGTALLKFLIDTPDLRQTLGQAARQTYLGRHQASFMTDATARLFERTLAHQVSKATSERFAYV